MTIMAEQRRAEFERKERRWQAIVIQPGDSIHDALWEETQKELCSSNDAAVEL